MTIPIENLLNGFATKIKNKQYLSTREYVEPFIDKMSKFTNNFICKVKEADQLSINEEDVSSPSCAHSIYNRVYVQAVLPESYWEFQNHQKVVGLIYGLDVRKPICKIYSGGLNMGCTNLCIFGSEYLNTQEILPTEKLDYKPIKNLMEITSNLEVELKKMKNTFIERTSDSIQKELGKWCDFVLRNEYNTGINRVKLSTSTAIDAYKDLFIKEDSDYYIPKDGEASIFLIYNAFTEIISHDDRDIINVAEKTLLLSKMLLK